MAEAIVAAAREKNLPLAEVRNFKNHAGKGVEGEIGDAIISVGSPRLASENGIQLGSLAQTVEKYESEAKTVIAVTLNRELAGVIAVSDTLKEDARAAIQLLVAQGIETVMITGDNRRTAEAIARQIGIGKVFAEVLPHEKAEKVRAVQQGGRRVAFVGDGINDAPALVQADLGISIGTGSDIAIEAGNIVLVKGNPLKVVEALNLSRITFKTIKQNLFWAFFYNIAAIPLAALGLLNPMVAAGAMAISSVSVVGNSLRIKRQELL